MHRFGRTAQQKMKDRWGGSFILATILALVGAWFAGSWLNDALKGETALETVPLGGITSQEGTGITNATGNNAVSSAQNFNLYLVQVGAFRSEASAQKLVQELSGRNFTALMAPRNSAGLYKVYAGLFTDATAANEAKARIVADGIAGVSAAWTVPMMVHHNPAAITVASMTDSKGPDVKKGLEAMNTYLHETALWIEGQSTSTADIATKGKYLSQIAGDMNKVLTVNPALKPLADLAAAAGVNATAIQAATTANPGSREYQAAMTGYLALLDQYRSLQAAAGTPTTHQ